MRIVILNIVVLLLAVSSNSQTTPPNLRVIFTTPAAVSDPDTRIIDEIIRLINNASINSSIRTSFYSSSDLEVAQALVDARVRRNVDVRVVLDDSWDDSNANIAFKTKLDELGIDNNGVNRLVLCRAGGCIGQTGNNHNKFFTFSETTNQNNQIVTNVTVQTSSNMTSGQTKRFQDMLVFDKNQTLYTHYFNYWTNLSRQINASEYTGGLSPVGSNKTISSFVTVFASPTSRDYILDELTQIAACRAGESRIDMVQSYYNADRGRAIIDQLDRLKNLGCEIHLVLPLTSTRSSAIPPSKGSVEYIRSQFFDLILFNDDISQTTVTPDHSKLVLLDYLAQDGTRKKVVYTGSVNMHNFSLIKSDDTAVRIENGSIYDLYKQQVETIRGFADSSLIQDLYVSYPNNATTFNWLVGQNVSVSPTLSSGGVASRCTITSLNGTPAALPIGIVFNTSSCLISGNPSQSFKAAQFKITATSSYDNYPTGFVILTIKVQEKINFTCSIGSNNAGCNQEVKCKTGQVIQSLKAGCNLETTSSSIASQVSSLAENSLAVIVPSNTASTSLCRLEKSPSAVVGSITGGTISISAPMTNAIRAICYERDSESQGDCIISGAITCGFN